jgi:hypothetical protein
MANAVLQQRFRADYEMEKKFEAKILHWARNCPNIVARSNPASGHQVTPLFILGSSRSGKSTIERLLGTFDGVRCGYETRMVSDAVRAANQVAGRMSSDFFPALPESLYPAFAKFYGDDLRKTAGEAAVFTNTSPRLIVNVPRIMVAIPNAKLIFVKRNAMDIAIRIFFIKYANKNYFSYNLPWIFDHIKWYHDLIDVFVAKYPENSMAFHYEDVVSNTADTIARLEAFCGLARPPGQLPAVGDDRGSSTPYRDLMLAAGAETSAAS